MTKVGCAGILVADTFCGPMAALPKAGELLAVDAMVTHVGGCAANVAIGLTKQGITAQVCGCVGDDPHAQIVLGTLENANIDISHIVSMPEYPTSQTVVLLVTGEDRRYVHIFGANQGLSTAHMPYDWLETLDIFYLGGLFVMPGLVLEDLRDVLRFCHEKGVRTVVDVVLPHYHEGLQGLEMLLPYIDCFLPNETEAARLTGQSAPIDQVRVLREHGAKTVIITQGERGALAAHDGEYWQAGVFIVDTIDPSGSGDAFATGVITGMIHGWDTPQTLRYAAALGASCTLKIGTTPGVFTADEANAFLKAHDLKLIQLTE